MNVLDWPLSRPRVLVPLLGASHSLVPHPHPPPPFLRGFPPWSAAQGVLEVVLGPHSSHFPPLSRVPVASPLSPGRPPAAESGDSFPFFLVT